MGGPSTWRTDRRRAGPGTRGHRGETGDQCRHGRLPAEPFFRRGDGLDGYAARGIPVAWRDREYRRLCRPGHCQRADSTGNRRGQRFQCPRRRRPGDRGDRPGDAARPDQYSRRKPGRDRPLDAWPSGKDQLLHGGRRRRFRLAVRRRNARNTRRCFSHYRVRRRRAAADHERMDHRTRGNPRDLCRGNARQYAQLLDLVRQLRDSRAETAS